MMDSSPRPDCATSKPRSAEDLKPKRSQTGRGLFLRLCDRYALGHDQDQWIIYKGRRNSSRPDGMDWSGAKYITTKAALKRQLKVLGVVLDLEAAEALEALPDTFKEWIQERGKDKC